VRITTVLLVVAALLGGIWLGGHSSILPGPLRDLARDDQTAVVDDALDLVHDDYYRPVERDELADDAVRGMVRGLRDRFSSYFDPQEYNRFREVTDARFEGIGVTVQPHPRGLEIVSVYDKAPADRAGLRSGDVIVEAAGKDLAGRPQEAASNLIRGKPGTAVVLRVRRDGKTFQRRVERARISIPVVQGSRETREGKRYAVISLETFSTGAHGELYAKLREAKKDDVDGLVFDLRGNGGGLVSEARLVASAFLEDGEIVTTRGRAVRERVYRATGDPVVPDLPMVVLVDRGSASASEIVAGALQDRGRAKLVGRRTFGKGVFQEIVELENGGALDITVGQYFLPSGRNLGGRGVTRGSGLKPDVRAQDNPRTKRRDEAVDRALAVLAG
jgi:carboxyl-terminal processing protease